MRPPHVISLGDTAFAIEYGDGLDPEPGARVAELAAAARKARQSGGLIGLVDLVPTLRSLLVVYDPLTASRAELEAALRTLDDATAQAAPPPPRRWVLPVCCDEAFAPDLAAVAAATGLGPDAVIARLCAPAYVVGMIGFLPGFAYLTGLDPALRLPRRADPRPRVPAGSVAIADTMAAIYPSDSPGGWHLLGRCPLTLFDPAWSPPVPLAAGDRVRFEPVDPGRFAALAATRPRLEPDPQR
ncbi:5-oxoprolinase subunit B family protein [Magnetospirillum fulvum]|uniref:Sensor histidine kinase inhibitor, KipI family n=1 Tax=Magnetospirillum fulvum TaxID=1082 RepID=A0A1H6JBY4_MAGFU|nr:allophanate hydrolase subunit 1 [Magnetospirillum fulvum]SEH56549.1 sensor histidine kinase inhibitor, KipI family [Magnetospirillum fulvum]